MFWPLSFGTLGCVSVCVPVSGFFSSSLAAGGVLKHNQQAFGLRPCASVLLPAPRFSGDMLLILQPKIGHLKVRQLPFPATPSQVNRQVENGPRLRLNGHHGLGKVCEQLPSVAVRFSCGEEYPLPQLPPPNLPPKDRRRPKAKAKSDGGKPAATEALRLTEKCWGAHVSEMDHLFLKRDSGQE